MNYLRSIMFKKHEDGPLYELAELQRELQQAKDAAADDPTLRMLGFDYLVGAAENSPAASHVQSAQVSFESGQLGVFRREMIIAAFKLGIDVRDLAAFQTAAKVTDEVVCRMVVQLASRALDNQLGYVDGPFAGYSASLLVH